MGGALTKSTQIAINSQYNFSIEDISNINIEEYIKDIQIDTPLCTLHTISSPNFNFKQDLNTIILVLKFYYEKYSIKNYINSINKNINYTNDVIDEILSILGDNIFIFKLIKPELPEYKVDDILYYYNLVLLYIISCESIYSIYTRSINVNYQQFITTKVKNNISNFNDKMISLDLDYCISLKNKCSDFIITNYNTINSDIGNVINYLDNIDNNNIYNKDIENESMEIISDSINSSPTSICEDISDINTDTNYLSVLSDTYCKLSEIKEIQRNINFSKVINFTEKQMYQSVCKNIQDYISSIIEDSNIDTSDKITHEEMLLIKNLENKNNSLSFSEIILLIKNNFYKINNKIIKILYELDKNDSQSQKIIQEIDVS